ncbi:MAG: hypothetical protein AAB975_01765, partial [Patescibacteria group bacterium]
MQEICKELVRFSAILGGIIGPTYLGLFKGDRYMTTMQDALKVHLEEINAVVAAHTGGQEAVNGEVLITSVEQPSPMQVPADLDEVDEDRLADILRARMAERQQWVATRDDVDVGLQQLRGRLERSESNLRQLYSEKPEIERLLKEETAKLADAREFRLFTDSDLVVLQQRVEILTQDLTSVTMGIKLLEAKYPYVKAKIDEELRVITVHQKFLERFAKETGNDNDGVARYVAKGTPTADTASVKVMGAFLQKSIMDGVNLGILVSVPKGESATFVAHDGSRWNSRYPQMMEGVQICKDLSAYEKEIHAADQKKLQDWADKDIAAGLLLTPSQVTAQKKSPQNRHNLVNMMRVGDGFCFVPVDTRSKEKYPADLLSYRNVTPEIRVEYGESKEGNKKHMLRVASVTAPQYVEDFFFPEAAGGKCIMPTFYFDDIHEIMTWQLINLV